MNDNKARYLQPEMEYQRQAERERLYLPRVLRQTTPGRHQKAKQARLIGIGAAILTALVFVPIAWVDRGYLSIGGEWMAVVAAYWIMSRHWR